MDIPQKDRIISLVLVRSHERYQPFLCAAGKVSIILPITLKARAFGTKGFVSHGDFTLE